MTVDISKSRLGNLNATLNEKHIPTDAHKWQTSYMAEYDLYVTAAKAAGLMPDTGSTAPFPQGQEVVIPTENFGGLIKIQYQNQTNVAAAKAVVNGTDQLCAEGMAEEAIVIRYIRVNVGDTVLISNASVAEFIPWAPDPSSQEARNNQKMADAIAANTKMIIDQKAAMDNKAPSGTLIDIKSASEDSGGALIANSLGAQLTGKGLNLLLGSTGVVTVTVGGVEKEVYNNVGLLSLLDPVETLVTEVANSSIVKSSGMGELYIDNYVAKPTS